MAPNEELRQIEERNKAILAQQPREGKFGSGINVKEYNRQLVQAKQQAQENLKKIQEEKARQETVKQSSPEAVQQDINLAYRYYENKISPEQVGGRVGDYLRQLYRRESLNKEVLQRQAAEQARQAEIQRQGTVIVNNQGFSVAPELQSKFTESKEKLAQAKAREAFFAQVYGTEKLISVNIENTQAPRRETTVTTPPTPKIQLYTQPTIYEKPIGYFTDEETGRQVQTSQIRYTEGIIGQNIGEIEDRPATNEDIKKLQENKQVVASDEKYSAFRRKFGETYGAVSTRLYQADISGSQFLGEIGLTEESIKGATNLLTAPIAGPIETVAPQVSDFIRSAASASLIDIKQRPVSNTLLFGGGYGIGYVAKGVPLALSAIPKVGKYASATAKTGVTIGGYALASSYVVSKGSEIITAPTAEEKGKITGTAAKDIALLGKGFTLGERGAINTYAYLKTLGRTELPLEAVTIPDVISGKKRFVESGSYGYKGPTGIQKQKFDLSIFEKKGYGYHATVNKFWGKELPISPGSSEFPGLYVAPDVSVYFLKTSGKSYSFLPKFKELFGPESSPGVAKIYSKFDIMASGNQRPGFAYTTGVKPEIEAVISPFINEGELIKKDFFFKYEGQRIPIDEFKLIEGEVRQAAGTRKKLSSSSYSGAGESSSVLNPARSGSSFISSSKNEPSFSSSSVSSSKKDMVSYSDLPSGAISNITSMASYTDLPKPSYSNPKPSTSKTSPGKSYVPDLPKPSTPYYPDAPRIRRDPTSKKAARPKGRTPKRLLQAAQGFDVFVKRGKSFKPIASNLPFGLASLKGSKAVKESLAATFMLKASGRGTNIRDINFKIDSRVFRTPFKGSKLDRPMTYIQKTGGRREPTVRGGRLASRSERSEIRRFANALR